MLSRTPIVPHAPAWECRGVTLRVTNLRHAAYSKADAERPELHTHAEHGHDRCSPECLSFLTLQRGNALGNAPRHRSAPRRILKAEAERPELHTHAEHGNDRCSPERLSFLTLQRGNVLVTLRVTNLRHAAYSKRTRSALNGIPTRSVGTIVKKCTVAPAVNSRRRRSWAGSALVWRIHKGSIPVHGPSCVARQSADAGRCCFRYYPTAPARFRR